VYVRVYVCVCMYVCVCVCVYSQKAMLKRIEARKPFYNHKDWDAHSRNHNTYLRNLCEFPFKLVHRNQQRRNNRRSRTVLGRRQPAQYRSGMCVYMYVCVCA